MHGDRSHPPDIALRQKVANIAIVWREPPLQPNDMTYSRVANEPLNFLGALRADREWPFAVHVLTGSDRCTNGFLMLGCGREDNHHIDVRQRDEVGDRLRDMLDAVALRGLLGSFAPACIHRDYLVVG